MKKLIALIAVLGFVPYAHAAEGAADFSHTGEFRLQYQNDMDADGNSSTGGKAAQNWHQRLRLGTDVRAGEKMTAHFTLVHNADWGSNPTQTPDTVGASAPAAGTQDTANTNNLLIVNEAYGTWMASDAWMIKFGRGSVTMADGRFISSNDFENVTNAFDGVLASWDQEMARLSFFGVEAAKLDSKNSFVRFYGIAADMKSLPSFMKTAHIHIVQLRGDEDSRTASINGASTAVPAVGREIMRAGASVSGDVAGLDWRVNYEMIDGKTVNAANAKTDATSNMIDTEIGYAMPEMMNSRFHFLYHTDTGDKFGSTTKDKQYDGFFYDKHNNAGMMDIYTWGNLTYMNLGAMFTPHDSINVGLDYFIFTQTEKTGATASKYTAFDVPAAADSKDELGSELDVWATKKYTNNFSITARYGMFMPGNQYKATNTDDQFSQLYVESKLTF